MIENIENRALEARKSIAETTEKIDLQEPPTSVPPKMLSLAVAAVAVAGFGFAGWWAVNNNHTNVVADGANTTERKPNPKDTKPSGTIIASSEIDSDTQWALSQTSTDNSCVSVKQKYYFIENCVKYITGGEKSVWAVTAADGNAWSVSDGQRNGVGIIQEDLLGATDVQLTLQDGSTEDAGVTDDGSFWFFHLKAGPAPISLQLKKNGESATYKIPAALSESQFEYLTIAPQN